MRPSCHDRAGVRRPASRLRDSMRRFRFDPRDGAQSAAEQISESVIEKNNKPPTTLKTILVGKARDPMDPHIFHAVSLAAFLAWVGLGADGLSSSAYGPEEAFKALGSHAYLSVFLAAMIAATVLVISACYSKVIELFPGGGGGYLVATKLLGPRFGVVSGCALIFDYVLTISTSVASGVDQIFSILPEALEPSPLRLQDARPRRARHPEPARRQGERADPRADLPAIRRERTS